MNDGMRQNKIAQTEMAAVTIWYSLCKNDQIIKNLGIFLLKVFVYVFVSFFVINSIFEFIVMKTVSQCSRSFNHFFLYVKHLFPKVDVINFIVFFNLQK